MVTSVPHGSPSLGRRTRTGGPGTPATGKRFTDTEKASGNRPSIWEEAGGWGLGGKRDQRVGGGGGGNARVCVGGVGKRGVKAILSDPPSPPTQPSHPTTHPPQPPIPLQIIICHTTWCAQQYRACPVTCESAWSLMSLPMAACSARRTSFQGFGPEDRRVRRATSSSLATCSRKEI